MEVPSAGLGDFFPLDCPRGGQRSASGRLCRGNDHRIGRREHDVGTRGREYTLPGNGWSPAESNHLVFTFDPRRELLALPYSRDDVEPRSSLVLIAVDADTGFSVRGEIDHQSLASGACPFPDSCFGLVDMQRGLFIDDWIYSISSAGVLVNRVDDLAPVRSVRLPQPPPPGPLPDPLPTAIP